MAFYLTYSGIRPGIPSGILSGIYYSDNLYGLVSGILSDKYSGILSRILSGILSDDFYIELTCFLALELAFYMTQIIWQILPDILSGTSLLVSDSLF